MKDLIQLAKQTYGEGYEEVTNIERYIQAFKDLLRNGKVTNNYGLTEEEVLFIIMLEGFEYRLIQEAAFNEELKTPYTNKILEGLDSALNKIPQTTHNTLYRQDSYYPNIPQIGDIINIRGYWTTSIEDFDNTKCIKWVITTLPQAETKAHDMYKVYNHGADCEFAEWQVEYERHAKFRVDNVIKHERFTEIFVTEIH